MKRWHHLDPWTALLLATCCPTLLIASESAPALPEPGGLTALPTVAEKVVALTNPGFGEQWNGWTPAQAAAFIIDKQPGTAHAGKACLRLDCGHRPTGAARYGWSFSFSRAGARIAGLRKRSYAP